MVGQHQDGPPASPALAGQQQTVRCCPSCGGIDSILLDEADTKAFIPVIKAAMEEARRTGSMPVLLPAPPSHASSAETALNQIAAVIQQHQSEGGISSREAMIEIIAIVESAPMQINTGHNE